LLPLLIDAQHLDFARGGGGSAALVAPPPRQLANTPAASVDCSNCIDFIHELAIASPSSLIKVMPTAICKKWILKKIDFTSALKIH
jgi:hypothetical protein